MKYIELEDLLQFHALSIQLYGGGEGLRDIGRLEAAIATQEQVVFGSELYPSPHEKAAAMMRGIIADHPFSDGNKRTGILTALIFLELNGFEFVAEKGEIEDFAVQTATDHPDIPAIAAWLKSHSQPRR